jgi:hypothetical protein
MLPRLVIDLDAADSKVVRRLEDLEGDALESPEDPKAMPLSAGSMQKKHRSIEEGEQKFRPQALKSLTTMPPDLLTYALLGDPIATRMRDEMQLRELFRSRGIQPQDNAETKLQQLTLDFTTNAEEMLRDSDFREANEGAIMKQISACRMFSQLHRMVSMLSRNREGCQLLVRNGSAIMESVRKFRKRQFVDRPFPLTILLMLNNLQLNLESKGVPIGPPLCNAALYYAARVYNLPAIQKYLRILLENSYATNFRTVWALKILFWAMESTPKGTDPKLQYETTAVLRLVTGWEGGRAPRESEQRDLSFACLFYQDYSADFTTCLYPRYIMGLGELRQSDALWAEWKSEDELRFPALIRGNDHMRFRAQMFALAFMVAKDQTRALEVLESVPMEHEDNVPADHASLIQNWRWLPSGGGDSNVPNTSCGEWLLTLIFEHHRFHGAWETSGLLQFMKTTIAGLSRDPVETLNALGRFLVQNLKIEHFTVRSLDWVMRNGEEGLFIMSPNGEGHEPVYWKPERPLSKLPG